MPFPERLLKLSLHFWDCKPKKERGDIIRTQAIKQDSLNAILMALTPPNRMACLIALCTGLRVSDVLNLKTDCLQKEKFTVTEQKTGKRRVIRLPTKVRQDCLKISGTIFIFPHRLNKWKTRTRQAVWKDLRRVKRLFKLKGILGSHSMRKTYARTLNAEGFTLSQIQKALNHTDPAITALYAYADELGLK